TSGHTSGFNPVAKLCPARRDDCEARLPRKSRHNRAGVMTCGVPEDSTTTTLYAHFFMKSDCTLVVARPGLAALLLLTLGHERPAEMRHVGPMAREFHSAFGLNGADGKHKSTVDEGGVQHPA